MEGYVTEYLTTTCEALTDAAVSFGADVPLLPAEAGALEPPQAARLIAVAVISNMDIRLFFILLISFIILY